MDERIVVSQPLYHSCVSDPPAPAQNPVWDDLTYVFARAALPDFSAASASAAMPSSAQLIEVKRRTLGVI